MKHAIHCETGPEIVIAGEPAAGLRIYRFPDHAEVGNPNRWALGTHDGYLIATFASDVTAHRAASDLTGLTDWTLPIGEIRALALKHKQTSLRFRQLFWDAITTHDGRISQLGLRPTGEDEAL
ncbi:hypothetical protein [Streptomyces sp. NEAU-H3]|uniref:hypothetical protein n=1 Tax=Streptomyces sp. NEAU-H3 TaxID=2720636 RepID=UPI001439D24B|nr:hypothetical protein [Streptomyces sp. NEAU-H3]NJA56700.1 hypothetical protein [Streptomyces sp. NEAU-H3]